MGRRADSTRSWQHCPSRSRPTRAARTGCARSWRCLCATPPQHLADRRFPVSPWRWPIAVIGQRHLEAELVVPKRLGRVDVVEEVPDRHAEPPLAKVAPDAMGRGVRRTCGVGADFAWHRAEDGSIGVERDELSDAGGGGAKPGADDGPRPPLFAVFVAPRVLPLLTLTRLRDGLGLRPGRRERERAGQQQCPRGFLWST